MYGYELPVIELSKANEQYTKNVRLQVHSDVVFVTSRLSLYRQNGCCVTNDRDSDGSTEGSCFATALRSRILGCESNHHKTSIIWMI
jgi:hypothetical protein